MADPARLAELGTAQASLTHTNVDGDAAPERIRLLGDVRAIFTERGASELSSTELAEALASIETSPWPDWNHGKPLSATMLARLLRAFGISPGKVEDSAARGYTLGQFEDAFARYLVSESVQVSETRENGGEDANFESVREQAADTLENTTLPAKNAAGGHFDTLKPENGREWGEKLADKAAVEWEA